VTSRSTFTSRTRLLIVATVIAAVLEPRGAHAAEGAPVADGRPPALREVGIEQRLDAQVPLDLTFRDEEGRALPLGSYFGKKPVVLALAYYECPMLCTLVLNGLVRALRAISLDLGDDFEVVTVSFDPRETPALAAAKKQTYLEQYGRDGGATGWHFLTGEGPAIECLAQSVGFRFTWVPNESQFAHAAAIMVLTPGGRVARYFYGVEYPPRDLRLGLVEAAAGTIGTAVDQLLLYCYRYDPATGKYGAVAMRLMRLGGVMTVIALGSFILISRRRERRRAEGA
jgi:protein SCO1/2